MSAAELIVVLGVLGIGFHCGKVSVDAHVIFLLDAFKPASVPAAILNPRRFVCTRKSFLHTIYRMKIREN